MAQKEFILCAAINYKETIVCGYRHGDCIVTIARLCQSEVALDDSLWGREYQGFLTSLNRYVDRKEAFKIAKANNQIWHKMHDDADDIELTSEDLYFHER